MEEKRGGEKMKTGLFKIYLQNKDISFKEKEKKLLLMVGMRI